MEIYQKDQLHINYYVIKLLILQNIQNMMNMKKVLFLGFIDFLIFFLANKSAIKNEQLAGELHKPIIRKFENEKYIHHLKTIFGVLIFLICS